MFKQGQPPGARSTPQKKATSFFFKHLQQVLHNRRTSMFGCQVQRSWTQAVCFVLISSRFYEGTYHIQMSMPSENPTDPQNGIPPNCFNCFNWWFFGITERVGGEILVFRKIRGLFIFSSSMQEPRLLASFRMYDEQNSTYASSYDVSTRTTSMILEETLHHLGCIKPCNRDKLPISWWWISEPSTVSAFLTPTTSLSLKESLEPGWNFNILLAADSIWLTSSPIEWLDLALRFLDQRYSLDLQSEIKLL